MRWAAKRDDSEAGIVKALEALGWTVFRLSDKGVPDLLAVKDGRAVPFECKSKGGTLTPAQEEAFERWLRAGMPVNVIHTPEEACAMLGLTEKETAAAIAKAAEAQAAKTPRAKRATTRVVAGPTRCEGCAGPHGGPHEDGCSIARDMKAVGISP